MPRPPHHLTAALVLVAALLVGLAACSSSKKSDTSSTTSAPASSTTTSDGGGAAGDAAAFRTGLGWFYSTNSATTPADLPADFASCTQSKLASDDVNAIAAVKANADDDNMVDSIGLRVFKASVACDRDQVKSLFVAQGPLDSLGITDAAVETCVLDDMIDNTMAVDESTATGTGGEALGPPLGAALQTCIPIEQGLRGLLTANAAGLPASVIDCIVAEASKTVTWASVIDQSAQTAIQAAAQTCGAGG